MVGGENNTRFEMPKVFCWTTSLRFAGPYGDHFLNQEWILGRACGAACPRLTDCLHPFCLCLFALCFLTFLYFCLLFLPLPFYRRGARSAGCPMPLVLPPLALPFGLFVSLPLPFCLFVLLSAAFLPFGLPAGLPFRRVCEAFGLSYSCLPFR